MKFTVLRDDNTQMLYTLTETDVNELWKAMRRRRGFAKLSIGLMKVSDIRHVMEYTPPEPTYDRPAIPLMDDESMREALIAHYMNDDVPKEEIEKWLNELETNGLKAAVEWANLQGQ